MKKRVVKSEIEIAKKSSRVLFIISFILFVFLFLGFGVIYIMNIDVSHYLNIKIPNSNDNKKPKTKIIKKGLLIEPSIVDVDINDSNILSFYNTVKISNEDVCIGDNYRGLEKVVVDDLSDKCKFSIASKIYEKKVKQGLDGNLSLAEEDVKSAYEGLFGTGTYKRQESIPCLFKTNFINHGDYYFTESVAEEEGTSLISFEKIIKAVRDDDILHITSAVVYYEQALNLLCKDSRCENRIETVKEGSSYGDEYLSLYVDYHKDDLYQYTYHFEMDSFGFYRYVGYDRTNH